MDKRVPGTGQLTGRPLLDSRADMALYTPRRQVETEIRIAFKRGLNTLLEGPRGSGKTTILRSLMHQARQKTWTGPTPIYVRAALAQDVPQMLELILGALTDPGQPAPTTALRHLTTPLELIQTLSATLHRHEPVVFFVDDVDPQTGNQLFGVLRDELWTVDALWVVTVNPEGTATLTQPPADAFFDSTVRIPDLTRAESDDLLQRRLGHNVQLPAETSASTPRRLLSLARHSEPGDWESALRRRSQRDTDIAKLGRPAAMLASILEELGPTSPSDQRLLTKTGWTPSRASQVLRKLAQAGYVTYREVRGTGPGRPTRVYELLDTPTVAS